MWHPPTHGCNEAYKKKNPVRPLGAAEPQLHPPHTIISTLSWLHTTDSVKTEKVVKREENRVGPKR